MPTPALPDAIGLHTRRLTLLLAVLAMLGPFSIDTYLPAFPAMSAALAVTPVQIQQTLTAYLAAFAVMTLWHGRWPMRWDGGG
jgi:DHA1 family bicyclomycin/chloramphenicol resistance-like MFS transporter